MKAKGAPDLKGDPGTSSNWRTMANVRCELDGEICRRGSGEFGRADSRIDHSGAHAEQGSSRITVCKECPPSHPR